MENMGLTVKYLTGKMFAAKCGNRHILIDQPREKGGFGSGLSPTEHFMISMASCIATYVQSYCDTGDIDCHGMSVDAAWELEKKPTRITKMDFTIHLPKADVGKRKTAVLKSADKCAIKNTLKDPPEITISLKEES